MNGSRPRLPQAPAHRSETVIFSVTAKDRTATSHPPTGLPASVDPLGLECPTDNGICTCLPSNSPIGIGRIRTCAPISSRPCTSGSTMERTASAWMWRTAWLRISTVTISMISKSSEARCIAPTARIRCMTGTKCTTSIANGARCSTSMIRRHSPSPKPGYLRSINTGMPRPKNSAKCSTSNSPRKTGFATTCTSPSKKASPLRNAPAPPPHG